MPKTEMHSPEAHEAISAELVRLTLGGRGPARPELRAGLRTRLADSAVGRSILRRRGR